MKANTIQPGEMAAIEFFIEDTLADLEKKINAWLNATPPNAYSIINSEHHYERTQGFHSDPKYVQIITYIVHRSELDWVAPPGGGGGLDNNESQ